MKLYILRHAETEFNRMGIVQGSSVDTDLNETGRRQARAFFDHYQDVGFELAVTSALKRTHQTISHFLEQGVHWHITPDINEISWGHNEGQPASPEWRNIWEDVRQHWNSGRLEARMPGGESAEELNQRLAQFLNWLRQRQERKILICSHGRAMRGLITLMKGVSLAEMEGNPHVNTGCYIAEYSNGQFHFEAENSTDHLEMWLK